MRILAIGLTCIVALGCGGPQMGQVTGVVTLDGQPVTGAQVTFSPRQGGFESTGVTDQSGRYVLNYVHGKSGAVVGTHQICITTERRANKDTEEAGVAESIPNGYNENSTLTAGVGRGSNNIDFALDSKAALTTDTEKPGERFH
jgi:hypothetical protein